MEYTVEYNKRQFEQLDQILAEELMETGVEVALLIDMAGNIIINLDDGNTSIDVYSLAALAAGNFGAVNAMAQILGEQDFSLLFHKGSKESIHFSKVNDNLLLISIFGGDLSLGFLRLKVDETIKRIKKVI